jgi:hypothetical protein
MKPSFALNLTDDSITLLHRTARGWMDVGSVSFGDPDMGAALDYLRSTALGLSADRIATKLIIPDSQVLYLQVVAAGPDDISRRAQVEAALDGRTPYALDELAFDWVANGDVVDVAVVARETLAEAEGFASQYRFNPVSFVARAENGFGKEPFFGTTAGASAMLGPDETVEADLNPVTIISREVPRAETDSDAVEMAPEQAPEASAPDVPAPDLPAPDEVPEAPTETPEPPPPEVPLPVAPDVPPLPEPDLPEPDLPEPELPERELPEPAPTPPEVPPAEQPVYQPPAADPPTPPVTMQASIADAAEAPMAIDVPLDEPEVKRAGSASVLSAVTPPPEDLPPPLSAAALTAFATRRAADDAARPLGAAVAPDAGSARVAAPSALRPAQPAKPVVERPAAARPAPKFSYDDPLPPPQRLPGDPPTTSGAMIGKAGKSLRSFGNLVTSPTIPGTRKKKTAPISAPVASAAASGVVQRPAVARSAPSGVATTLTAPADATLTAASVKAAAQTLSRPKNAVSPEAIGRGLGARTMPQRGKPRFLGLILTGVLLLILALVAAWSSFYLTRAEDPPTEVATEVATVQDEALADGVDLAASDTALPDAPADPEPAVPDTATAVVAPTPVDPVLVPEPAPQTGVETMATGAFQSVPATQDEIFLAAMDTPPRLNDPLVMPQPPVTGDALPAAQMPPPPFGTVYQFDANGRIVPTADGIVTPEGVTLVAGAPPVRPPLRPTTSAVAVAAPAADTDANPVADAVAAPAVESAEASPAETFAANPDLADARPQPRPAGLAPAAPEADTDASLAPEVDSRFASLRPRARPAEVLAAGEAARRASESASLALQAAAVEAAVASADAANLSPLAVSVSRVPAPRPRDLSRAVEAAVAAATRQPAVREEPQQASAAASTAAPRPPVADEDNDEPEVASTAAPRIPTKANVAKQATFTNAINLSRINLIGVYGTQSNRTALVRQANGRYRKVSVGDNIDGGRVQAITATEVRYQKGGRLLSLALPKG